MPRAGLMSTHNHGQQGGKRGKVLKYFLFIFSINFDNIATFVSIDTIKLRPCRILVVN